MLPICQKRDSECLQSFLNITKDQLIHRAGTALKKLDVNPIVNRKIANFGQKLAPFAGNNMNALWATIVLGEWLESIKVTYVD